MAIRVKQGDTIRWAGTWRAGGALVNLTGYTLESEMRAASGGALAATLTCTLGNQGTNPGTFTMHYADTSAIAVGDYVVDIRVTEPDADSYATESWTVLVVDPVTAR